MKKQLLAFYWMMLLSVSAFAQIEITGQVKSSDGSEAFPGVSILEKGTTNGTVTDLEGRYSISLSAEDAILVFSFVGYESQEISVAGKNIVDVVMDPDIQSLSEVVVIGYGEVDRNDVTGAVATLGTRDFNPGVTTSPQDLLTGKMAGVNVTSNNGAPGAGSQIRIRGGSSLGGAVNDPLIVIDGFPVDDGDISGLSNPLNTLNPDDIESFTVLKDASAAAIYGSRASNGVIIITTKKGTSDRLMVNFNSQISLSTPTNYVDVLNGDEYRELVNGLNESGFSGINDTAIAKLGNENTDWQKEIFRSVVSQNYNLSVNGLAAGMPFRASYGFTDQKGILKTTETSRHTLSLNLTPSFFSDHLKVNVSAKGTLANTNFGDQTAVGAAVNFDPTQPVYNGNERYGGYFAYTTTTLADGSVDPEGPANTFISNPVSLLELRENVADVNRFIGNVQLDYKLHFFPDLKANLNVGIDKTSTDGVDNALPGSTWTYRNYTGGNGRLVDYTSASDSELLEFYLNYNKAFDLHNVDFVAGYSWQHWQRESTRFDRNTDGDQIVENSRYIDENYLISFYGRLIYSFDERYVFTATLRNDGSSRFLGDNQWGLFPSLAFAWNLHNEEFFSAMPSISNLKLRLGYGVTGQQGLSPTLGDPYYPALAKYRRSIEGAYVQLGDQFFNTLRPSAYDANLKWEETTTYNLGLDFGLWNDKLSGSVEIYQRETKDLLNRIPIADGSNFSNYLITNVGSMEIKGVEFSLTGRLISTSDFTWSAGANFTYNNRKITRLNKTEDPSDPGVLTGAIGGGVGNTIQIHTVGYAPNSFYTFEQIYDNDGNPIEGEYVDRVGDGGQVISNQFNKYHNQNPNADYLIGINSRLNYHSWDFSFSGRLSLGNYVYNNGLAANTLGGLYATSSNGYFTNIRKEAADIGFVVPQYWSDLYVQNASFFKMDNISLGYNLESILNGKVKARLSFTVQNAFIITDYQGIDPEVNNGIDNNLYPRPRTYLLGINFNF
ncbi:TonB-dependent receptor [Algoriphagus sp. D3-2-R+10]|uniref:SusC/RagA family TonB-linked outer membrane protein n=1 Tax=Algoriphagus aurantiacus TaxID=3103948 RepID=UPI002B3E12D6|nr:TonB-dependent receptor [Algoriphagus sp. D3-2-R+10]MEB2774665.1 TonB-dependent receptor [Algoriphagus sp. D3-2-R+10]